MPFIEKFILPPPANHLTLFGYLIILVSSIHMTFIGIFLGSSLLSVIYNILDKKEPNRLYARFSKDLLETGLYNVTLGVILGILPLVALTVLFSEILYGSGMRVDTFLILVIFNVAAGLGLLYWYQRTYSSRDTRFFPHIGAGVAGLALLFAAYFILTSATSLIVDFEKRSFIRSPDPYSLLFSWNVIARYAIFILASLAIAGGGFLFHFFKWSEDASPPNEEYERFVTNVSAGVPLACLAALPVFFLWDMITLPGVALSGHVFGVTVAAIVLIAIVFFMLLAIVRHGAKPRVRLEASKLGYQDKSKLVAPVLILFLVTFSLISIKDQRTIQNALRDHSLVLAAQAEEAKKTLVAKLEKERAKGEEDSEKVGEEIFATRCSTCHRYDKRLVGPPFSKVLPKYQANLDDLAAFIQSPTKKNPGYPPMPNLGLNHIQAMAAAKYVLQRLKSEAQK